MKRAFLGILLVLVTTLATRAEESLLEALRLIAIAYAM